MWCNIIISSDSVSPNTNSKYLRLHQLITGMFRLISLMYGWSIKGRHNTLHKDAFNESMLTYIPLVMNIFYRKISKHFQQMCKKKMKPICNYPNTTSVAAYMMGTSCETQYDIVPVIRSFMFSVHVNVLRFSGGIYSVTLRPVPFGMQSHYNY